MGERDLAGLEPCGGTSHLSHVRRVLYALGVRQAAAGDGFMWRKAELVPSHLDLDAQKAFVDEFEELRNCLEADEAIAYSEAVRPSPSDQVGGRLDGSRSRRRDSSNIRPRPNAHPLCD